MAMFGPLRQYFVKSEIRACWKLLKPWWVSEERWIARGLFLLVFLLDMAIVAIGVWLTYWNKNFFNAFADYDLHRVWLLMLEALLIAACGIVSPSDRGFEKNRQHRPAYLGRFERYGRTEPAFEPGLLF